MDTEVYYIVKRLLNPKIARWLSFDPLGLAVFPQNLYSYVSNRPILSIDPSGEKILIWGFEGFLAAGTKFEFRTFWSEDLSR